MRLLMGLLLLGAALAQDKTAPMDAQADRKPVGLRGADPISDHLRYEISRAQTAYLLAAERLKDKIEEAQKACAAGGQTYDAEKFACADKAK
jgi:hypothetical protein